MVELWVCRFCCKVCLDVGFGGGGLCVGFVVLVPGLFGIEFNCLLPVGHWLPFLVALV